jgi:hypothetical protein
VSVWTPPPGWVGPGAPAASWGPQPHAVALPTATPRRPRRRRRRRPPVAEGGGWYVAYGMAAIALPILGLLVWVGLAPRIGRCAGLAAGSRPYTEQGCRGVADAAHLLAAAFGWWLLGGVVAGVWCGLRDGRGRRPLARGQTVFAVVVAVVAVWTFAGYAIGYLIGRRLPAKRVPGKERPAPPTLLGWLHTQPDVPAAVAALAGRQHGAAGGHIGWDESGNYLGARPRGGMLVIGPPGSGKSSGVIIPSILVAPGAVVSSSIKTDTMADTAAHRALVGTCWHFDPGADQQPSPGVEQVRWSPLVSVRGWDDARRIASRMAEPMRHPGGRSGGGDSAHFVDRARDWLEVLLYAAHLDHRPIGQVADWAASADQDATAQAVLAVLLAAAECGDAGGARIAQTTLEGLLGTPDRERGSVLSTLARMLRIYGSLSARQLGQNPNFDPQQFVRSTDTLYLTATPERQHEYAPLIAALLEEIRYAVYGRHRAEDDGREPRRPHVMFALDEANNTAPIPLPAIISEAGGQVPAPGCGLARPQPGPGPLGDRSRRFPHPVPHQARAPRRDRAVHAQRLVGRGRRIRPADRQLQPQRTVRPGLVRSARHGQHPAPDDEPDLLNPAATCAAPRRHRQPPRPEGAAVRRRPLDAGHHRPALPAPALALCHHRRQTRPPSHPNYVVSPRLRVLRHDDGSRPMIRMPGRGGTDSAARPSAEPRARPAASARPGRDLCEVGTAASVRSNPP